MPQPRQGVLMFAGVTHAEALPFATFSAGIDTQWETEIRTLWNAKLPFPVFSRTCKTFYGTERNNLAVWETLIAALKLVPGHFSWEDDTKHRRP